jgi:2-phospho-L-lactate transferase/gluconeogenesis factor (CofD/UPF0052 family)
VYICNIVTQPGETDNYSAQAHLTAVEHYLGKGVISTVILTNSDSEGASIENTKWVLPDLETGDNLKVIKLNGVDENFDWRHDSDLLAREIIALVKEID